MKIAGLSIAGARAGVSIVSVGPLGAVSHLKTDELALPDEAAERAGTLREALLGWKEKYGIKGVVFGVEFWRFSNLTLELPLKAKADVVRALPFELEKHLPLSPDEYLFDAHVLRSAGAGTESLVLAVRADSLRWIGQCLEDTGLELLGVRSSFMEALNEFVKGGASAGTDALFVLREGEYYCIAGIKVTGGGDAYPSVLKAVKGPSAAADELQRLKDGYKGGIYISGANDLSAFVGLGAKQLAAVSAPAAVAHSAPGRRMRGGRSAFEFDFTPLALRTQRKDRYRLAVALLAGAAVFLLFFNPLSAYYKDYRTLKSTEGRINEIKETARELLELKRGLEEVKRKKRFLTRFQEEKNIRVRVLSELSGILPADAWLTHMSVDRNGVIELNGFAGRAAGVIGPLEQSALFKNVTFSNPITTKDGRERFTIKMELEI